MSELKLFLSAIERQSMNEVEQLFRIEYANRKYDELTLLQFAIRVDTVGNIVRFLINEGCDVETEDHLGNRSIHYAVSYKNIAAMKALIEAGCYLDCTNNEGRRPLDEAELNEDVECIQILKLEMNLRLLADNSLSTLMVDTDGKTVLDILLQDGDETIIEAIKSKPITDEEIKDWKSFTSIDFTLQECLLYRCMQHNHQEGYLTLCTPDVMNGGMEDSPFMDATVLECAVEFGSVFCVERCLRNLISADDSWTRASANARALGFLDISSLISERGLYVKSLEKRGYSRLHIAVYDNEPRMITYLLQNKKLDPDFGDKNVGTALSLAYDLGHSSCVRTLQEHRVNVNTVDRLKQSPLHLILYKRIEDQWKYLIENMTNFEHKDCMGFTVLELSVLQDRMDICEELVKKIGKIKENVKICARLFEDDPNLGMVTIRAPHKPFTNLETIYSMCIKVNKTLYPCLLDTLDNETINSTDSDKNTLLHLCAISLLRNICFKLIRKSANTAALNKSKETPLLALLGQNCDRYTKGKDASIEWVKMESDLIETVKVLRIGQSSGLMKGQNEGSIFEKATEYNNEKLLIALVEQEPRLECITEDLWCKWFDRKYFTFLARVIPLLKKESLSQWITRAHIEKTPSDSDLRLLKLLYGASSQSVQSSVLNTMLYRAANINDNYYFKEMLQNAMYSDHSLLGGESLLISLIREKKTEYVIQLLKTKNGLTMLEKKHSEDKLPLHVCIENNCWDIIDEVLWKTKSIDEEDRDGHTPLSLLFCKMSEIEDVALYSRLMAFVRQLISKSANINRKNYLGKSAISYCTKPSLRSDIEGLYPSSQQPVLEAAGVATMESQPPGDTSRQSIESHSESVQSLHPDDIDEVGDAASRKNRISNENNDLCR